MPGRTKPHRRPITTTRSPNLPPRVALNALLHPLTATRPCQNCRPWQKDSESASSVPNLVNENQKPASQISVRLAPVPRNRLELSRTLLPKGFSCHYSFRCQNNVCGPDYSFTIGWVPLGVSCLVSAPSFFQRLGSRLPADGFRKGFLEFTTFYIPGFPRCTQICLSPSCLPFHHQGIWLNKRFAARSHKDTKNIFSRGEQGPRR